MARKLAALLVCVVFVFATGCAKLQEMVQQDKMRVNAVEHEATLEGAIMMLGYMEATLLEGIEEAFAYVLLKETVEKEDHYLMMRDFDRLVALFNERVNLDAPEHKGLKAPFERVVKAKVELEAAAFGMFDPLENGRKVCKSQIVRFERAVDRITQRFNTFMARFLKRHYKEGLIDNKDTLAAIKLSLMQDDMLEGVEEFFGFMLLKEADERDDFFARMKDFDKQAAAFAQMEYIDQPGNERLSKAFHKMMDSKEAYEVEAVKLIKAFPKTWKVDKEGIAALEGKIDAFTMDYADLMKKFDYLRVIYKGRK